MYPLVLTIQREGRDLVVPISYFIWSSSKIEDYVIIYCVVGTSISLIFENRYLQRLLKILMFIKIKLWSESSKWWFSWSLSVKYTSIHRSLTRDIKYIFHSTSFCTKTNPSTTTTVIQYYVSKIITSSAEHHI